MPVKGKVIKNIQNLKEHVVISGSTTLHGSAIINSRDAANNVWNDNKMKREEKNLDPTKSLLDLCDRPKRGKLTCNSVGLP
jgi:hypothetical protein